MRKNIPFKPTAFEVARIVKRLGLTVLFGLLAMAGALLQSSVAKALPNMPECRQYMNYARGAGAMGTYGTLQRLYQACMASGQRRGRRSRRRSCKTGFYRSGNKCVKKGHKACPDNKHSCPKDMKCIAGGCAPQDASACPSGAGRYCKAPHTCAVGLDGKEGCYTTEGLKALKVAKERKQRRMRRALVRERERIARERFERQYGQPYKAWLELVRGLVAELRKLPPDRKDEINRVKQQLDDAFTPEPIPAFEPSDEPSAPETEQSRRKQCEKTFALSKLWDEGFRFVRCTDRQWAIARKVTPERDLPNCVALNKDGKLFFEVGEGDDEAVPVNYGDTYARVGFADPQPNAWLLEKGDRADVRVNVDGSVVYDKVARVRVSDTPPLRYGFGWQTRESKLQPFIAGYNAVAQIADRTWKVSLNGSANAIQEAERCVEAAQ
jgi:hypothetical protein